MASPSTKTSGRKKIGEATITFFDDKRFEVSVTGQVSPGGIQKSRRQLYKASQINIRTMRRARSKEVKAKVAAEAKKVEVKAVAKDGGK